MSTCRQLGDRIDSSQGFRQFQRVGSQLGVKGCGRIPDYRDRIRFVHLNDTIARWCLTAGLLIQFADPDRVGLLPDFFELREQTRAGPAINPGTVGSSAGRLYGQGPLYDFRAFRRSGLLVHAPGKIVPGSESERSLMFTVCGWPKEPYFVLVNGFTSAPAVKVNAASVPAEFHATEGRLILKLTGKSRVEIER